MRSISMLFEGLDRYRDEHHLPGSSRMLSMALALEKMRTVASGCSFAKVCARAIRAAFQAGNTGDGGGWGFAGVDIGEWADKPRVEIVGDEEREVGWTHRKDTDPYAARRRA